MILLEKNVYYSNTKFVYYSDNMFVMVEKNNNYPDRIDQIEVFTPENPAVPTRWLKAATEKQVSAIGGVVEAC